MSQFVTLLFSIANFFILIFLLRKFLREPTAKFFASRSQAMHQYIEGAHAKHFQAESELQQVKQRQQNLAQEMTALHRQLEQISLHERDLIAKRAHEQAERVSREAKLQVEQDRMRMKQMVRHNILEQTFSQVETELQHKATHANAGIDASLNFLDRQLKEPHVHVGGNT